MNNYIPQFPLKRVDVGQAAKHTATTPILWVYGRSSISFGPECLKWQIYLLFNGIQFQLKAINEANASPNNRLPFLELPHREGQRAVLLKDDEIKGYVEGVTGSEPAEMEAHESELLQLVEKQLRASFLTYHFFVESSSRDTPNLYFPASKDNKLVEVQRMHRYNRMQASLSVEIAKVVQGKDDLEQTRTTLSAWFFARMFPSTEPYEAVPIDVEAVDRIAADTLAHLSSRLGSAEWVLGKDKPSYVDASLFAYLYLTLSLLPPTSHLRRRLTGHINLTHYTQHIASDFLKARI
ncbi:hypothetical protein E3P99_02076 [Wallemia hederae]|uniref:GST N-terminal domain-containing protein n=1 Tax=Wallemia hederae TaxID=1540922 RepID=A0A4T0FLJ8_9BASI|nr:hypothetical protein E3P99_02076 [Wallemia hederae]